MHIREKRVDIVVVNKVDRFDRRSWLLRPSDCVPSLQSRSDGTVPIPLIPEGASERVQKMIRHEFCDGFWPNIENRHARPRGLVLIALGWPGSCFSCERAGRLRFCAAKQMSSMQGYASFRGKATDSTTRRRALAADRSLLADLATDQFAGVVVILNDVDVTALLRIALHDRKFAVLKLLDFLGLAVKIVIVDLADQDPM